jgi:hypothetical protein
VSPQPAQPESVSPQFAQSESVSPQSDQPESVSQFLPFKSLFSFWFNVTLSPLSYGAGVSLSEYNNKKNRTFRVQMLAEEINQCQHGKKRWH